jgi:MbtH protein
MEKTMRISDSNDDRALYKVLVNPEEQYSIWPAGRENPAGWTNAGKSGAKEECLAYIARARGGIRPRSLRPSIETGFGAPDYDPHRGLGLPKGDTEDGANRPGCPMGRQ